MEVRMTSPHRFALLLTPLLAAACTLQPVAPAVPAVIATSERYVETLAARGVQVYECRLSGSSPVWAFVAPDAALFDSAGRPAGKHYAGPQWEALDGSKIQGAVKARTDAATANAIPWLLLSTKAAGGAGTFSKVTSIQRINTVGGTSPSGSCTLGATERVPYTADYVIFAAAS
jgi:hypothetical protein